MKKLLEWPKNKRIVAIDFDGTLTKKDNRVWEDGKYYSDIMEPRFDMIDWVKRHRDSMYLILWSCRTGVALEKAICFCRNHGIEFDVINENIVAFECSNKIMADYYIDDKSINPEEIFNDR